MTPNHFLNVAYAYFFAIKFAGYTLAARYLNKTFPDKERNVLLVGFTRTLIGVTFGLLVFESQQFLPPLPRGYGLFAYIVGLSLIRSIEWTILIRSFYWTAYTKSELLTTVPFLIIWSFILDVPASLGLLGAAVAAIC